MNSIKYNIAIVDDHPIVIEGLKMLLSPIENISIDVCLNNGTSLFGYNDLSKLDVIFLDVFLPDINGIDLCLKIKKLYPKIVILAMSSQSERSIVMQMIKNGANGYLLKSASLEEFRNCIDLALAGKLAFCNEVQALINQTDINDLKAIPRLTVREKEILTLLKQGKSTQEISDTLFLSFLTVQTHRRNLLHKFQVKNLVELLNFVSDNGVL
ncbi:response regulator transcription factor [Flavobacterium sp. CYK-4]|uniref:response regulator n=1 Tax=Flavobacterium lotistagni TaxID=2709660 RepID=UPI001407BD43|nr:response regulator transcription factor [Flavobacterium lotistagni]NHM07566.1 response regulator transcription factor [Flavobacterium lotistagni]